MNLVNQPIMVIHITNCMYVMHSGDKFSLWWLLLELSKWAFTLDLRANLAQPTKIW